MSLKDLLANAAEDNFSDFERTFESIMNERIQDVLESKYDEMFESEVDYDLYESISSFYENEDLLEFVGLTVETESYIEEKKDTGTKDQPWANAPVDSFPSNNEDEIGIFTYMYIYPMSERDFKSFKSIMNRIAGQVKGGSAKIPPMKPVSSIVDKVKNRNKDIRKLGDIIRGTILVKTTEDMAKVDAFIHKKFKVFDSEAKVLGGDKDFGYYGSLHYDIRLPGGNIAEVQLMTRDLWNVKGVAHDIYNKHRSGVSKGNKNRGDYMSSAEFKADQKASRDLFRRGTGNKKVTIAKGPNVFKDEDSQRKKEEDKAQAAEWNRIAQERLASLGK